MTDHGHDDIEQVLNKYLPPSPEVEQTTDDVDPAPQDGPEHSDEPDQQPQAEEELTRPVDSGPEGLLAWLKANLLFICLAVLTVWGLIATFTG